MDREESTQTGFLQEWLLGHQPGTPGNQAEISPVERESEHESGFITLLYSLCSQQLSRWGSALANNTRRKEQQRSRLKHIQAKFYLFGDSFDQGKLESCLNTDDELRLSVLTLLFEIGKILGQVTSAHRGLVKALSAFEDDEITTDLRKQVSRARDILEPECSDTDLMASASSEDEPIKSSLTDRSLDRTLFRALAKYVDLLMDLCPTLEQTYRKQHQTNCKPPKPLTQINVTTAAVPYVSNVRDKYPLANSFLVERLGEANWQRHERLRAVAAENTAGAQMPPPTSSIPPKSLFEPVSIFKDSALGSSIPAQSERTSTIASHSSFISSIDEQDCEKGRFRVPQMPIAIQGEPLTCPFCNGDISSISSRVVWKIHVFADLQAYICTFNSCSELLRTFPTRKQWFEHEKAHFSKVEYHCQLCGMIHQDEESFLEHSSAFHGVSTTTPSFKTTLLSTASSSVLATPKSLTCSLCLQSGWLKHRDYATHVGKHLENIALCALPPDLDGDDEDADSLSEKSLHDSEAEKSVEGRPEPPMDSHRMDKPGQVYWLPEYGLSRHIMFYEFPNYVDASATVTTASYEGREGYIIHAQRPTSEMIEELRRRSLAYEEAQGRQIRVLDSENPREYWLPGYGLSRYVVLNQTQLFLGPSARVKPWSHHGRAGYLINGARQLTTEQLADLGKRSAEYERQQSIVMSGASISSFQSPDINLVVEIGRHEVNDSLPKRSEANHSWTYQQPDNYSHSLVCPFKSLDCEQTFMEATHFKLHVFSHFCGLSPPTEASCFVCGKMYVQQAAEDVAIVWNSMLDHLISEHSERARSPIAFKLEVELMRWMHSKGLISDKRHRAFLDSLKISKDGQEMAAEPAPAKQQPDTGTKEMAVDRQGADNQGVRRVYENGKLLEELATSADPVAMAARASSSTPHVAVQQMPANQQLKQLTDSPEASAFHDFYDEQYFNLDFGTLDNTDVMEDFDFDSFASTSIDDMFNFDGSMGQGDFDLPSSPTDLRIQEICSECRGTNGLCVGTESGCSRCQRLNITCSLGRDSITTAASQKAEPKVLHSSLKLTTGSSPSEFDLRKSLREALAMASTAVELDEISSVEQAINAYTQTCNLLQGATMRSCGSDDGAKLQVIHSTYMNRISELRSLAGSRANDETSFSRVGCSKAFEDLNCLANDEGFGGRLTKIPLEDESIPDAETSHHPQRSARSIQKSRDISTEKSIPGSQGRPQKRRYVCELHNKVFAGPFAKSNYHRHLVLTKEHGSEPFVCHLCKKVGRVSHYKAHMGLVHNLNVRSGKYFCDKFS